MSLCIVLLLTTPGFLRSTASAVPSLEQLPEIMTAFARMRTVCYVCEEFDDLRFVLCKEV